MLDDAYTHVGVGVAFGKDEAGLRRLRATLLFGRRVPSEETRQSAESILSAIQSYRARAKLPALRVDGTLMRVAGVGARALETGGAKTAREALATSGAELQREVDRARRSRTVCQTFVEILERAQLSTVELLSQPELAALGVGVVLLTDDKGSRLGILLAAEASPGKTLRCH